MVGTFEIVRLRIVSLETSIVPGLLFVEVYFSFVKFSVLSVILRQAQVLLLSDEALVSAGDHGGQL